MYRGKRSTAGVSLPSPRYFQSGSLLLRFAWKRRADERARTADLSIANNCSAVAGACAVLQMVHIQGLPLPCFVPRCAVLRSRWRQSGAVAEVLHIVECATK